ncbi:MAG: TolC family protein, partial [Verrucomicrobiales bacterium]
MSRNRPFASAVLSRATAIALLPVISACQTYWPKPLDPQATASSFGRRRLDDPALHSAMVSAGYWKNKRTWPPSPWRLRDLQGAALLGHPEIAVAKAKAASARAAIGTANTAPNPGVSFSPELGQGTSPWVLGFAFDWQIETANKRGERTAKAQAESNAAVLSIADTAWSVSAGVRTALLDLETATRRLEILEAQRENDTALVTMVSARVTAGEAPRTDLGVYLSQQSRDLVELADGRSKLDSARAKLASAVGIPASA